MANHANEKVKRLYLKWLRGPRGCAETTIVAVERALHQFEESTSFKCFKTFSERQATAFKAWLDSKSRNGRAMSNTTKYHTLRLVKGFFSWLASQPGYRSRISLDAVSYLTLDRRTVNEVLSPRPRPHPSLEQVKQLVESIDGRSELDRRDRAIVSFLLLTGIRYQALCSLNLGGVDLERREVSQEPRSGVHTKFGKAMTTMLLPFDEVLIQAVQDWVKHLREVRRFAPTDPLFPRTRLVQAPGSLSFRTDGVEPVFWRGGNSVRDILRTRSESAGLRYYPPHSYRHAACHLAIKLARTPEELKALSQNFGHEHVLTTLRTYGTIDQSRVADIISGMDFGQQAVGPDDTISVKELMQFAKARGKRLDL